MARYFLVKVVPPNVVSPTGLEGICQKALPLWGIPFHGMVEAA